MNMENKHTDSTYKSNPFPIKLSGTEILKSFCITERLPVPINNKSNHHY